MVAELFQLAKEMALVIHHDLLQILQDAMVPEEGLLCDQF